MDAKEVIQAVLARLQGVLGIEAIVLGGSRAMGTHVASSDIDIGLYYRAERPLDLTALGQAAAELDDERRHDLLTALGGWGPWINGGGWLQVGGIAVDFIYRELGRIEEVITACRAGRLEFAYQPGHPHGFASSIYMGEVAYCRPLWDPRGTIAALKEQTAPYPEALSTEIIRRFFWEAEFSLKTARKGAARGDLTYVSGSCFRCVSALLQTLFALNGRYLLNEKGALATATSMPHAPHDLRARVEAAFRMLGEQDGLAGAVQNLEALVAETDALLQRTRQTPR